MGRLRDPGLGANLPDNRVPDVVLGPHDPHDGPERPLQGRFLPEEEVLDPAVQDLKHEDPDLVIDVQHDFEARNMLANKDLGL